MLRLWRFPAVSNSITDCWFGNGAAATLTVVSVFLVVVEVLFAVLLTMDAAASFANEGSGKFNDAAITELSLLSLLLSFCLSSTLIVIGSDVFC